MAFTSATYLAFLAVAFLVHWTLPARARNAFLVLASYAFYCSWRPEHGLLLLGASLFNWALGAFVLPRARTAWPLLLGVAANLALLVVFKYAGFLAENLAALGVPVRDPGIALPLGVSFFVFQGVSYLVDVAAGEEPLPFLDFLVFRSFWAQLVAGPIVRAGEMREDIGRARVLEDGDVAEGARRILVGLAKKVVLADSIAGVADAVYAPWARPTALDVVVGTLAFGLQVYFDFAGYSDLAIGTARLFGFKLPENFDWPYAARSPQEFWNRWHMTLSRWIRDYVHAPLAFATRGVPRLALLWILVAMVACGFWHGARWTFVLWGVWHGLLLALDRTLLRGLFARRDAVALAATFLLVNAGWLLFRASSLEQARALLASVFTLDGGLGTSALGGRDLALTALLGLGLGLARVVGTRPVPRWGGEPLASLSGAALLLAVLAFSCAADARLFIYFQF
jgi:alginate O-acetyltransferase complex protein AlgI